MCNILNEYKEKDTFTGYKVAEKRDSKYYSIVTGIEYKPGPVEGIINGKPISKSLHNSSDPNNYFYLASYFGRTSVYKNKYAADDFIDIYFRGLSNVIVLKMKLSGDLRHGDVNKLTKETSLDLFKWCISGTNIVSLEEC